MTSVGILYDTLYGSIPFNTDIDQYTLLLEADILLCFKYYNDVPVFR